MNPMYSALGIIDGYLPPARLLAGPYHPGPGRPGKTGVAAAKRAARRRRTRR